MDVKIKRFDKTLPIPEYKTAGAAAFDLYSREDITIQPNTIALIPLNVAIQLPKGYFLLLVNRSSTYKLGITCINGLGIGDSDYCGDNDEYMFPAINYTKEVVHIEKGTRVCQALILPVSQMNILDVKHLENKDRGGFGTTGNK
jgi:dUTP pyrophosphatase